MNVSAVRITYYTIHSTELVSSCEPLTLCQMPIDQSLPSLASATFCNTLISQILDKYLLSSNSTLDSVKHIVYNDTCGGVVTFAAVKA